MIELVLKSNYFKFNRKVKQQLSGTAIGTKYAPQYACIFMNKVETNFLEIHKHKKTVWLRCIHDIFFIWENAKQQLEKLDQTHTNLTFTYKSSMETRSFLDLSLTLSNGKLYTDFHIKATNFHQYLRYISSHPDHTKKSRVYSQTLRFSKFCSFEKDC